jgi:hypothetical protein
MDDMEKKLLCMIDSEFPGERSNGAELLHEHQKKIGHFCRDIVNEAGNSVPLSQFQDMQNRCTAFEQANIGLANQNTLLVRQLTAYKAALNIKLHWKAVFWLIPIIMGGLAYDYFTGESQADREAARPGFESLAAATRWINSSADSAPVVRQIAGKPYWVIARYRQDLTHRDDAGKPVNVQCVQLYGERATPDAGAYTKPRPYSLFGLGWLTWSERANDCRTDTMRSAKK